MNVTIEEEDSLQYSIYECLYNKNYPGWSEKLEEHKSAILQFSNLIERKRKGIRRILSTSRKCLQGFRNDSS